MVNSNKLIQSLKLVLIYNNDIETACFCIQKLIDAKHVFLLEEGEMYMYDDHTDVELNGTILNFPFESVSIKDGELIVFAKEYYGCRQYLHWDEKLKLFIEAYEDEETFEHVLKLI